jgi:dihydroflavonol-4-reductase
MKVFVTGSTGLLGSNLVDTLVVAGHEVKALARSQEKAIKLLGNSRVQIVIGDMENVAGFTAELKGVDVLFHTAAYFREYYGPGDHWAQLERINVKGTIQLFEAAERQGVKKVIYVSSSGVISEGKDGQPGDESAPPGQRAMENLYLKSKVLAEDAVYGFLKTHSLPVVFILPTVMFGPRDAGPTGPGQVILDFLGQKLPGIPPGGFNVVDARDVGQVMVNAVERGKSGERYIVNNEYYSLGDIFSILTKVSGIPAPKRRIPYPIALAVAYLSEARARLTGVASAVTVNGVRTLNAVLNVRSDKAKRELGATLRPFEETLRDEVEWYIQNGYVSKQVAGTAGLARV